jgi:multidrug resistance efflux pump
MAGTAAPPMESSADRSPDSAGARPDLPALRSDVSEQARVPEPRAEPESRPVRRWALVVLGICAVLFVYHLFADRLTPFTTQASVNAFVVPVSPEVAGLVTEVNVVDNQRVAAGEVLVRIDAERYQLAIAEAEATLAQSGQDVGAAAANVSTAQAQLEDARAHLTHMRKQSVRVENLVAQRAMAAAHLDQAIAAVAQAEAAVAAAEANVAKAKEQLGPRGSANPKVKAAISALGVARRQLEDTIIRAPSRGVITGLQIAVGNYAAVGRPLMTFIAADEVWIEADMRENNLGRLKPGDPVEIVLDVDPGAVHAGRLVSIGWGVGQGQGNTPGELPTAPTDYSWVREARRFPVRIELLENPLPLGVRVGSQASVIVYTGDHPVLNTLGRLRIRLSSILTYVY